MKFLILDTNYTAFLESLYSQHQGLSSRDYTVQWRTLMDQCFGTADFFSSNLQALGHKAHEVVVNCDALQRQWAREHAVALWAAYPSYSRGRRIKDWQLAVFEEQVRWHKPDVVYIQDVGWADAAILRRLRPQVSLIVGQIASALPDHQDLTQYDLILSPLPYFVDQFREQGLSSEYFKLAFEASLLGKIGSCARVYNAAFVGGYTAAHRQRLQLCEQLAFRSLVDIWGYGLDNLASTSAIRQRYRGEAWGLEMYRILRQSNLTVNSHVDIAGNYAANMRLYEATGVGTCLLTDMKMNLSELFDIGTEVVAYTSIEDCIEKLSYLLDHQSERAAIAAAGQQRTLREHTYFHRMQELVAIIESVLRGRGRQPAHNSLDLK
jgi:spore maturation protein CgeB